MSNSPYNSKPRKEAYYVQIENADKSPIFVDVSAQLGKNLNVSKPLATCMMRVRDEVVLFSTLRLYKKVISSLMDRPLVLQPGPLARLERRAASLETPPGENEVYVELEGAKYGLEITRDENGVSKVEYTGEGEEPSFELPRAPLQMVLYMRSPRNGRLIVAGWQGYQNKPGNPETVSRAVALALNHLAGLAPFSLISGVTTVKVPASPGRYQVITPKRKPEDRVEFTASVMLWAPDAAEPVEGKVKVNVDLDDAYPTTARLLFHSEASKEIADVFEAYRTTFESGVLTKFTEHLGTDELTDLVCDIALGDLGSGDMIRLREAASTIHGFHVTQGKAPLHFDAP